ncbi:MAG: hypothetical protein J2P15_19650 [Micromonosporaceae bacterium]|nr:hypothetical protein [Micromonosporaceae bacterium]
MAAPAGTPSASGPRPTTVCTVTDGRLTELSGMVRTPDGFVVIDDGSSDASHWRIFFLNNRCAVTRAVRYPSTPRDTEDLARAPDGTIWVADIGDNNQNRQTVALWRLAPCSPAPQCANPPVLYRLTYPDGPHDAEALVLAGDGTPVIATKDPFTTRLYQPDGPLRTDQPVPMHSVGEFALPGTGTSNPFGLAGRAVVTGGADSPDGSRVVLRTYADAFEFPVTGGDVVRAITTGTPVRIPLPDEPQGESVAYDSDGVSLLTVSEGRRPPILRYPRVAPSPRRPADSGTHRSPRYTVAWVAGIAGLVALGAVVGALIAAVRRRR